MGNSLLANPGPELDTTYPLLACPLDWFLSTGASRSWDNSMIQDSGSKLSLSTCPMGLTFCDRSVGRGPSICGTAFTDWVSHTNRFDQEGEALLAARVNRVLAGIGGITIEPVVPGAVRMRRFYTRLVFRRNRVGHQLATALLNRVGVGRPITVNAAPASFSFWESVGFMRDPRNGHTHILVR